MMMYCRPLTLAPAVAVAGLASVGFAEPTAQECKEAAVFFADVLNPKAETNPKGIGWAVMPGPIDYYTLAPRDQWRELVRRFTNIGVGFQLNLTRGKEWHDGINPEFHSDWAKSFLMDDTLEQCLRPLALASAPELQSEVAKFDSKLPQDVRANLRKIVKASQ
jgi:hypothetical protein